MPPRPRPSPFTAVPPASLAELSPSGPYRGLKQLGLVILCAAWILLGLVGHDPWKVEDATTFGVAWDMMQTGRVLAPTLAGEPYVDRPPLIPALAALSGRLLSGPLAPHDAARLAVGALLAVILVVLSATARELGGSSMRWLPLLIFIGSIGLWDRAHLLSPEIGLLAGLAVAQYGLALAGRRPVAGGVAAGLGATLAFLSHGLQGVCWIAGATLLLPVLLPSRRTRSYVTAVVCGLAVAVPGIAAWPLALAGLAPDHLAAWWGASSIDSYVAPLNPRGWADPFYLLKNITWVTWPALPLVLWTVWTRRRGFNGGVRTPALQVPAAFGLAILAGLVLMPDVRAMHLMMLIPSLALIAALEVDTLSRGFSAALDWFGILTFGLLGALAWWIWWDARLHGMSLAVARVFRDTTVGYQPGFDVLAMAVSVFLTALWIALVRPARRSNRRAVLNWAAGTTLLWALYMTIWLPYLDSRRSYRIVAETAALHLAGASCIASRNLGEAQRALIYYFAGLATRRVETQPTDACDRLIVQYAADDPDVAIEEGWKPLWTGQRRGDNTERFVVYARAPAAATTETAR